MTERAIVLDRDLPHPPEKVWRALTLPHLVGEWLRLSGFSPVVGHVFEMVADWGRIEGRVLAVEPARHLSYSWGDGTLDSTITWTLTPTEAGTRLRMEQRGFPAGQPRYYGGARANWPHFLDALGALLDRTP